MRFQDLFPSGALDRGTFGQRAGHLRHRPADTLRRDPPKWEHLRQSGVVRLAGVARWDCGVQTGRRWVRLS
jgi:hypothetical protein